MRGPDRRHAKRGDGIAVELREPQGLDAFVGEEAQVRLMPSSSPSQTWVSA
jgi:hypothetical protein